MNIQNYFEYDSPTIPADKVFEITESDWRFLKHISFGACVEIKSSTKDEPWWSIKYEINC